MYLLSKIILLTSISFLLSCTKISPDAPSTEDNHSTSTTQTEDGEEEGDEGEDNESDEEEDDESAGDDDTSKDDDTGEKTDTKPEENTDVPSKEEIELLDAQASYHLIYSEITKINDEISDEEGALEERKNNQRPCFMEDLEKYKSAPEKEVIEAELALLNARDELSHAALENLRKISQAANDLQKLSKLYVDFLMAQKNGVQFKDNNYPKTPKKSFLGRALKYIKQGRNIRSSSQPNTKDKIEQSILTAQKAYENAKKSKENALKTYKKMIADAEASLKKLLEKYPEYGNFSQK